MKQSFWKRYYVYIISSIIIVTAVTVVLVVKKFWPFGDGVLLNGDFVIQGWTMMTEFREKLASGESLLYTWNAGFGTNFLTIFSFYLVNPFSLLCALVPTKYTLQVSTVLLVLNLLLVNSSMLFFLTHRPFRHLEKNHPSLMMFSLSFTLCVYMVSNIDEWLFLPCMILYPLVILGLENYVAGKGWKLYLVTFALAFLWNYYLTGLFCVFIILYYLTLEFGGFRVFLKKSLKLLLLSVLGILCSGVLLIPTMLQTREQSYAVSGLSGGTFFTTIYDVLQQFFFLHHAVRRGSASDSYGEVNLYYGIGMLMLTLFYFFGVKEKRWVKLRKLAVTVLYLCAFNVNLLNYIMHLFHYPTWFPNRFSVFFTLFCIILAYDAWVEAGKNGYKLFTIPKCLGIALSWVVITVLCLAFAQDVEYQICYTYTILLFLLYMILTMLLPYGKKWGAVILTVVVCLELALNFDYTCIFRDASQSMDIVADLVEKEQELTEEDLNEENGYSRYLLANDVLNGVNSGMFFNLKGNTFFSSTISDFKYFLHAAGVVSSDNAVRAYTYTPATMSMLGIQYIFYDDEILWTASPTDLYTENLNKFSHYPVAASQEDAYIYENETVLSVGYMIGDASDAFDTVYDTEELFAGYDMNVFFADMINAWIYGVSGVDDVMQQVGLVPEGLAVDNCEGAVADDNFYITQKFTSEDQENFFDMDEDALVATNESAYSSEADSVLRIEYVAPASGEYFIEIAGDFTTTGYVEEGDSFYVYYVGNKDVLNENLGLSGAIRIDYFDEDAWMEAYEILAAQQLSVTDYSSNTLEGTIQVEESGTLFLSIPYDSNWELYVDGVNTEITPLWGNSFLSTELEEGTHTIKLVYKQSGLPAGAVVSAASILIAIFLMLLEKKKGIVIAG